MNLMVDALEAWRLPGTHLLGPIDLCINKGERWALVGESGSGKSLLAAVHRSKALEQALARLWPLLDALGLPRELAFLDRFPQQASGGERQRNCLPLALLQPGAAGA